MFSARSKKTNGIQQATQGMSTNYKLNLYQKVLKCYLLQILLQPVYNYKIAYNAHKIGDISSRLIHGTMPFDCHAIAPWL